jgi:3-oxoacyl-[acyl-carrier protein] reductase
MNIDLKNKNAFVSGGSGGIGRGIALALAGLGANVTVAARSETKLQSLLNEMSAEYGQKHDMLAIDYSQPEKLKKAVSQLTEHRRYHILINNSGGPPAGPIIEAKEEDFLKAMNMHLICNHILAKALVPGMKADGYGRIINIISSSVKTPLDNLGVSNTTRGAVASWGKSMANELGPYGITVNNVLPGFIDTDRLAEVFGAWAVSSSVSVAEFTQKASESVPLKRIGKVEEIANVVAFLASPAGSYVSGVNLPVDGGRTKAM